MLSASVQWFYLYAADVHLTAGIMALDCECAAVKETIKAALFGLGWASLRLGILDGSLTIYLDRDFLSPYRDVVVKPLFIFVRGIVHDIPYAVEAPCFFRVFLSGVDLGFESLLRPAVLLELGVKVEAGIGSFLGQNLEFGLEVFEGGLIDRAAVEEMRTGALDDDFSVTDLPGGRRFVDSPSVQALTVEEFIEPVVVLGSMMVRQDKTGHHNCECECAEQFHSTTVIMGRTRLGNANRGLGTPSHGSRLAAGIIGELWGDEKC